MAFDPASVRRPSRLVLAATALSLSALVAACTTAADSVAPSASTAASEAESMAPSEAESMAPSEAADEATVLVAESDLGDILTDAEGNTIYFFANDSEGTSTCAGDCLTNWPPVPAEDTPTAGDGVEAELGTAEATDGTTMLTVNGFPAYYFAGDSAAGDTNGQGVGGVWFVFGADGEPIEE
jgi:predicted lipoprotein with Yx(FWY)xxD motif